MCLLIIILLIFYSLKNLTQHPSQNPLLWVPFYTISLPRNVLVPRSASWHSSISSESSRPSTQPSYQTHGASSLLARSSWPARSGKTNLSGTPTLCGITTCRLQPFSPDSNGASWASSSSTCASRRRSTWGTLSPSRGSWGGARAW